MKVSKTEQVKQVTFKTKKDSSIEGKLAKWWLAENDKKLCDQLLSTTAYLKEAQTSRQRQAAIYARLYGNMSLFNFMGNNIMSSMDKNSGLPTDRPTFNLIQSCVDTLVSRITQSRPAPVFLTDNGDYRERNLAKKLNNFILGEFYRTKTYEKTAIMLKDALIEGTGILKVYETADHVAALDRVLLTELLVDANEAMYGEPKQMYQVKLMDRDVLIESFPKFREALQRAESAFPDTSSESTQTVSDLVMVVEGWKLRSGKEATDGRHTIACTAGILLDEEYKKDKFPFVFLHYSNRLLGFWAQGLAEQLMGTQLEINSLLHTISKAIKLVGVPRIFQEKGSKVNKAAHNNEIGTIIEYSGTKPSYEVAQCVPQELYAQLQRLIDYGYQQSGVSALSATSQKPAGLDSGEAIRSYDDISTDRMALLSKNYDNIFVELAYQIIDLAKDISMPESEGGQGKYSTVYPNKNGIREIDLPKASLLKDSYVIQCFNMSSLPRDPAGRMQKVVDMIQSGMITLREGRRLLDFPDTQQMDMLANASEERIFKYLDEIVESGKYTPPDPLMDLDLAIELSVQYYNLYVAAKLEQDKADMLLDFKSQCDAIKAEAAAAMAPPTIGAPMPGATPPQATAEPLPQSPLVSNAVGSPV